MKSQSVGYGNKEFLGELVKFIRLNCNRTAKQVEERLSKRHSSKVKEV